MSSTCPAVTISGGRKRKAAAERLGQHQHVGHDAGVLEGEQAAGAAEAGLDLVHDQRDAVRRREPAHRAQPPVGGWQHTSLALDHLEQHPGRRAHAAGRVLQQPLDVAGAGQLAGLAADAERAAVAGGERQELHLAREPADRGLGGDRPGGGQRAVGHTVVAPVEGQKAAAAGGGLGELPGRLHGVGAARPAELDARAARELGRELGEQLGHELVGHRGGEVEGLQRQAAVERRADRLHHHGMVVTERERAGARQAVDKGAAVAGGDVDALAAYQGERQVPRVGPSARLAPGLPCEDALRVRAVG